MLTNLQKRAAQAIVVVFETGDARGDYGAVTVIPGDTGHLTYGRLQATLGSGNLYALIERYSSTPNAARADALRQYLPRLKERDRALDEDDVLRGLLEEAGEDPVMHAVQDTFFDEAFWVPSTRAADRSGISTALGVSTVFDGFIQGSWSLIRDTTNAQYGLLWDVGESSWVSHYITMRREWLANNPRPDLRATVYRMDAYGRLIEAGKWSLNVPFQVLDTVIDEDVLLRRVRTLGLRTPFMKGDDVRALQRALAAMGFRVDIDGVFGPATDAAVREFQRQRGLRVDGIVGRETRDALRL